MSEEKATGITKKIYEKADRKLESEIRDSIKGGLLKAFDNYLDRKISIGKEETTILFVSEILMKEAFRVRAPEYRQDVLEDFVSKVDSLGEIKGS